jgi:membrane associated rhomboid family serine protease
VNPDQEIALPVWAKDDAFPSAPDGCGWVDPKGGIHACQSETELREAIGSDRDARVVLIWTPHHPRMILPEEWPAAVDDVREGRRKRLNDDLAVTADRIRWYGLLLGGMVLYLFYQGWRLGPEALEFSGRLVYALQAVIGSMSVGLCLLMFLILGFIPWYQARKRQREWRSGDAAETEEWLAVLRFETWLERQKAPATRLMLGLVGVVGLAQMLPSHGIEAAGLMKDAAHQGQWWRVYTAPFLHGNPLHFLMNAAALLYLGKRLEVFARWPHVPLVFLLSAAVGNEASLRLLDKPSVGASGGLLGWLGFLLVFESLHSRLVPRSARRRLLAGVVLTAVIGLIGYQFIDNAAHAGGLFAGMLYAVIVFPKSSSAMRPVSNKTDIVAGSLATVLLVLCAAFAVWRIVTA